jgi:hypothetical protein
MWAECFQCVAPSEVLWKEFSSSVDSAVSAVLAVLETYSKSLLTELATAEYLRGDACLFSFSGDGALLPGHDRVWRTDMKRSSEGDLSTPPSMNVYFTFTYCDGFELVAAMP